MTEIETIAKGLTDGERERLLWGRRDWRDSEWEDHCGDPNCQKCTGYIPEPNISQIRKEDLAVRDYLKGQPC